MINGRYKYIIRKQYRQKSRNRNDSPQYKLDVNGDVRVASGSDFYVNTIGLNDNASSSSGASLIGLYDDTMIYITGNTTYRMRSSN